MIPMNYNIFGNNYLPQIAAPTTTINTLIGSVFTGNTKYISIVNAQNGKLYCVPDLAAKVLEVDIISGVTTQIGTDYSSSSIDGKWGGGILAPNGKIYCIPLNYGYVMVIDTINKTTTNIGTNYGSSGVVGQVGSAKWHGGVLADNGKIYCIPRGYSQMLEIDPSTDTTSLVGSVLTLHGEKYLGGVYANGNVYGIPCTASSVLVYNVSTGVTSYIATTSGTSSYKFGGGVLALNGKIYATPCLLAKVLEIDIVNNTTSLKNSFSGYRVSTLGKNGKIYCVPFNIGKVLEIDTDTGVSVLIGNNIPDQTYYANTLGSNGKIYAAPHGASKVLEIDIIGSDILGVDRQIPSDLSTLATSNYNKYYNNR